MPGILIVGLGSGDRGDDAAGLLAARAVAARAPVDVGVVELDGRIDALLDLWRGKETTILIDASVSGRPPGTVQRLDASRQPLPAGSLRASTHDIGPAELIELARALGELPPRVVVYLVESFRFEHGEPPTDAVRRGASRAAAAVIAEISP